MPAILFTGLSGSGKTTLVNAVKATLKNENIIIIDGDVIRSKLNRDLFQCDADRTENIRRISEVVKILLDNNENFVVLISIIAPFKSLRKTIKEIISPHRYYEVFVSCPLEVCEERDPKSLYKDARKKCVNVMTGLGSKYEEPENPDLIIKTNLYTIDECVKMVIGTLPL